jgi:hypothetical protein
MEAPVLPPPPEEVVYDLRWVARRWQSDLIVVEELLQQGGVEFVDIPQPAKKGIRLADLLRFEAQRREAIAARDVRLTEDMARQKQQQQQAQDRARTRKEAADRLVAEAKAKKESV